MNLVELAYETSSASLVIPKLPANKLEVSCEINAYPRPNLKWTQNNRRLASLIDSAENFFVNYILTENATVGSTVYIDLNNTEAIGQYKCLMNDLVLINDFNLTLIGILF